MAVISDHVTQTVSQPTTIEATTIDMQVLTDAPLDAPVPLDAFDQSESFWLLWQTITQRLGRGGLQKDHPSLIALVDVLKQQGVLPSSGTLTSGDLTTFHQWFQGLETDQFSDSMTYLEALILYQWNESLASPMLDQVIVFDALNAFNQYAIYCQVIVGDEVVTLHYQEPRPIQYDESQHSSFGILLNHQWVDSVDSAPVNYATAHTILDLSTEDRLALDHWLATVFPNGWDHLSDEDMIMAVYTKLLSDEFEYQPEIGDQWATVSQFLDSKTGDCEEFSHVFYSALQVLFESSEQPPAVHVLAGLVGSGLQTYGHSVVQVTLGDTSVVIDLTGEKIPAISLSDFPTLNAYTEAQSFDEMLRYDHTQTTLNVDAQALRNFSTASSMDDQLELQYKAVFGQDSSFQSVTSTDDSDYTIDGYDSLIKKVIGLEMVRLLESGQMNGANVVLVNELSAFQYVHAVSAIDGIELDDIYKINAVLTHRIGEPLTRDDFSFLSDQAYNTVLDHLMEGDSPLVVQPPGGQHHVANNFGSAYFTGTNQDIFQKLIDLGFIFQSGFIDPSALNDATKIEALRSFYRVNGNANNPMADELLAFLTERAYVYSDVASVGASDPFESALLRFEQLSGDLFHGLTASTTPIYAAPELNGKKLFSLSEFVVNNGYVEGGENSLFIRIDHQKMQHMMAMFYSLQNTISAFMTIAFSISDMVSSISAKLGEENATASSTSKQRQKIMQVFNSYTGAISESINTLTDIFNQSVQKTNEARYQTAISEIDFEFSDFGTQLGDAFLAKEYAIQKERLKAALSQDYYRMLRDNRQSMQRAMIDVPNFGPNIMPSMFSHFFINQPDQYHGLTSMQIWSALYAHGVIDEYGLLTSGVDLTTTSMIDLSDALPVMSSSIPEADRMNGLLHEQFAQFKDHWVELNLDQKNYLLTSIRELLVNHQRMIPSTSSGNGMTIVHAGMGAFDTSRFLFSVMDLMERESDSTYAINPIFDYDLVEAVQSLDPNALHNTFGSNRVSEESLRKYESYELYIFPIPETSDFINDQDLIDAVLRDNIGREISSDDFTFLTSDDEKAALFQELKDLGHIVKTFGKDRVKNQDPPTVDAAIFPLYSNSQFSQHQVDIDGVLEPKIGREISSDDFTFLDSDHEKAALFEELKVRGHITLNIDGEYCVVMPTPSNQTVSSEDIFDTLNSHGVIDSSGNILDAEKLAPGQPAREAIDRLFARGLQGSYGELLYQDLRARQNPDALHLTSSASASGEPGSGFQVLDADMVSLARKNFMLMNAVRRVYMTLASAQTQFFERIASKLSKDATSSSHYGDIQSSLMESHMGIAERQLSSIQSDTVQMVSRINDLHKMRLNIVKMGDPTLRGLDMASTWFGLVGALLMLAPTPATYFAGIFLTMVSQVLSLAESWRGLHLEESLHQKMDESAEMGQLNYQVRGFFQSNLQTGTSQESSFITHAGAAGGSTDVIPRSVVDYANAHLYINPDSTHVQQLLHDSVFPNGVPTQSADIIRGVHAFMNQQTTYQSDDPSGDNWASVDDTAQTLSGDCEDLVNLEHSLLLAAFQASGGGHQQPTAHAAYVQVNGQRVGHVYLTIDLDGETVVLDPSLATDGDILSLHEYQQKYQVEDVFTYTDQRTNVLNPEALGIQTSALSSYLADGLVGMLGGGLSEVFGTLLPDDFIAMFIPDVSDPNVFNGRFQFDHGASNDEIIKTLTSDALDLMFDTFMGNAGQNNNPISEFFGDMTASAFRLIMEPLLLSFAPGTPGHDIANSASELTGIANRVLGDAFRPDPDQIRQTLTNRYSGTQHLLGIEGGTSDEVLQNLQNQIGDDFEWSNDHTISQYQFQLPPDSSFYMVQPQINAVLEPKIGMEISSDDFTFLDSDHEKAALFQELKDLGHIVEGIDDRDKVKNPDAPTVDAAMFPLHSNSQFSQYQVDIDGVLQNKIGMEISSDDFTFLDSDHEKAALFQELKDRGHIEEIFGKDRVKNPDAATVYPAFSSSIGFESPGESSSSYSTDHTAMIRLLFQDQKTLTTDFSNQSISSRHPDLNHQFFGVDSQQKRVILNPYNVDEYKDNLRIIQEQLRVVFLLVKAVSDHLATLAANIGDENKVKVAAGLQKIFETSFGLVNNDIQLKEHILNHYASARNHNFEVDKIRYERLVDSSFKTVTFLPVMMFPIYGQLIDSAIGIFQTMAMYYGFGGNDNPYSDIHLHGNDFQGVASERYALSDNDGTIRDNLKSVNQLNLEHNADDHLVTLDPVVNFRQKSFEILNEAAQIPPKEQGVRLTLPWVNQHGGEDVTLKSVDYDAFNQKRTALIRLGMQAQSSIVMFISLTGFLSSLTKAIRGDGKVGAQHLSSMIDVIEREVMHDIDALDAIQSMQEAAVSFNNRHFESLKRVERVVYEAIFFGTYFSLSKLMPISALGIIMVKALANMFQGILLSYVNLGGPVENELDREDYFGREYNESANANVRASAYDKNGQVSTIDYSGISNYENNYLGFSNDQSRMILDYSDDSLLNNALGLGFKSVNWFEFAYQNIMLRKLFTQWNLMLKQGETVAEAYQNIADELGASVSTLSYSRFLKSQMTIKKTGMMKNLSNRFSAAGEIVGVFNAIQTERFETFQQFFKVVGLGAFKWWLGYRQKARDKKMEVLQPDVRTSRLFEKHFRLTMVAVWAEDLLRLVAGAVRSDHVSHRQAQLLQDAEQHYFSGHGASQHAPLEAGSQAEAMLYASNIKKAKQKVNADIISKWAYYQALFKAVIQNIISDWSKKAKDIGNQQVKGDASFVKDQSKSFSRSLMSEDHAAAQKKLTQVSAYLMDGQDSYKDRGVLGFAGNFVRSIKSTVTRGNAKNYYGSFEHLEANNGVWTSIRRSRKQMIHYGGDTNVPAFDAEMDILKNNIQRLHQINQSRSDHNDNVSLEQLVLLQKISTGLRTLHEMMERYDDYRQSPKKGKFFSSANIFTRISQSQYGQLGTIADNVESFALYGTLSTVVSLNQPQNKANVDRDQKLRQAMQWLTDVAKKDPKKVYSDIGGILTQLSHKKEEQTQLATFFEKSLRDPGPDDSHGGRNALAKSQRDFVMHVLACQKGGFKLIMERLKQNHDDQKLIDLLSNGSDGVIDLALKMGNNIGAKRLLHAVGYSYVPQRLQQKLPRYIVGQEPGLTALKEWMLTSEKSKHLADLLVRTKSVDESQAHDLTDGYSPFTKFFSAQLESQVHDLNYGHSRFIKAPFRQKLGWRRNYTKRLKRAIALAREDIENAGDEHEKQSEKIDAFNDFLNALNRQRYFEEDLPTYPTSVDGYHDPSSSSPSMVQGSAPINFDDPQHVTGSNIDQALAQKLSDNPNAEFFQKNQPWFQKVYQQMPMPFIKAVLGLSNQDHRRSIIEQITMRPTEQLQLHIIAGLQKTFKLTDFEGHLDGAVQWQTIDWSGLYKGSSDTPNLSEKLKEWLRNGLRFDQTGSSIDRANAHQLNQNRQQMLQYIPGVVLKQCLVSSTDLPPLSDAFITDALRYQPDLAVLLLNQHPSSIPSLSDAQIHRLADVTAWVSDPKPVVELYRKMLTNNDQSRKYIQSLLLFHPNGFESLVMHMTEDDRTQMLSIIEEIAKDNQETPSRAQLNRGVLGRLLTSEPKEAIPLPNIPDQALEKAMVSLSGYSLAAYDALSLSQRTELLSQLDVSSVPTVRDRLRIHSKRNVLVTPIENDEDEQMVKLNLERDRQILHTQVSRMKSASGQVLTTSGLSERINQNQLRLFDHQELKPCLKPPPGKPTVDWLKGVCKSLIDLKNKESAQGMNGVRLHQKAHDFFTKHKENIKTLLKDPAPNEDVVSALWYFAPGVAAECLPIDDQVRRMSDRVQHLVADSMLRQQGAAYRPVSEITTQFSLIPKGDANTPIQTQVLLGMMDQFSGLLSHHSLASGARMFDVVDAIVSSEMSPTIQSVSGEPNIIKSTQPLQVVQALKVLPRVQGFLDSLIDNGVVLNDQQQQRFLALLDQCSSKFKEVGYGYRKEDDNAFASKMHGIEKIVGLKGIQIYRAKKVNRMSPENPFLKSLRDRVEVNIDATTSDSPQDGISALKQFRVNPDAFFSDPTFVENMTHLHQFSPGDFNEACVALGRLESTKRDAMIQQLVTFIYSDDRDVNQAKMVHDLLFSMHEDHKHPHFLRTFIDQCYYESDLVSSRKCKDKFYDQLGMVSATKSRLFSGKLGEFLIQPPLAEGDRLTPLQAYFVAQFREEFYVSQQSIRNWDMKLNKYLFRGLNTKALSNLIQCVVDSGPSDEKSAGWMMVAQLLSNHEGNQTRAQKAQLVQYVIHEVMTHSKTEEELHANIQCLLNHVPSSKQDQVCAEISHYFKKGSFRSKASRGIGYALKLQPSTTSYSSDPNHEHYQWLLQKTIDVLTDRSTKENVKAANERLLAHLIIQAADHQESSSALNNYIGSLEESSKGALARKCELLISDSQLASLKKAYPENPENTGAFNTFVWGMHLVGAQQTHLRAKLLKATMIQKIKTDDAVLHQLISAMIEHEKYVRNYENSPRTNTFSSVSHVNPSLSVGG